MTPWKNSTLSVVTFETLHSEPGLQFKEAERRFAESFVAHGEPCDARITEDELFAQYVNMQADPTDDSYQQIFTDVTQIDPLLRQETRLVESLSDLQSVIAPERGNMTAKSATSHTEQTIISVDVGNNDVIANAQIESQLDGDIRDVANGTNEDPRDSLIGTNKDESDVHGDIPVDVAAVEVDTATVANPTNSTLPSKRAGLADATRDTTAIGISNTYRDILLLTIQ